jgi:hypothetical protein
MSLESLVSDAPNCGITFTIVIEDNSLGQDKFIVQASFIQSSHDNPNIFIVHASVLLFPAKSILFCLTFLLEM